MKQRNRARKRLGRRKIPKRAFWALAILLPIGCQSYEPSPLAPEAHHEAWLARSLDDSSLAEFVDRMNTEGAEDASAFDPEGGVSLAEGELVALCFNPMLRMERLRAERARVSAGQTGRWNDPQFSLGVMRINDNVPDRWYVNPSLTFTIPLSGRLAVQRAAANAELNAEELHVLESEWTVRHETRKAWFEWSAAQRNVEETERLAESLSAMVTKANALADAGEMGRSEATLFVVEAARRRNELIGLRGELGALEQRLRARMGLTPFADVELVPEFDPGEDGEQWNGDILKRNPTLARLRANYDTAEAHLALEIKKQVPDLTIGPQLEEDGGQTRVGFIGGLPIPVLNANRRAIAEARVDREIARAAFETEHELLNGRLAESFSRWEALVQQRLEIESDLVPLVDRQLENALRVVELGEGSSLVLFESLTTAHETKLQLIQTRLNESIARAEMEYAVGPEITPNEEEDEQ